jgi:mannosyltransferase OCH1-like enzyme
MTKSITQILITDSDSLELSSLLEYATNTVKYFYPECEYTLYNNQMIIDFIKKYFDEEVLWAYNTLKPYAFKSDLARYCITYIKGGWYADITVKMISRFKTYQEWDMIFFQDGIPLINPSKYRFAIQNGLFYTIPKNIVLKKCIEIIVENCKNKFYGKNPLSITGPTILVKSYLEYENQINSSLGIFQYLTPSYIQQNLSYFLDDGQIIAQYKSTWHNQNIFDFGIKGLNCYVHLWNTKNVYGEKDD